MEVLVFFGGGCAIGDTGGGGEGHNDLSINTLVPGHIMYVYVYIVRGK